jgi:hypothetical protein
MLNVKLCVYWQQFLWQGKSEGHLVYTTDDFPDTDYRTKIAEVYCDVPEIIPPTEFEIKNNMVKQMRSRQERLKAETQRDVEIIESQIKQLLCITDNSKGNNEDL